MTLYEYQLTARHVRAVVGGEFSHLKPAQAAAVEAWMVKAERGNRGRWDYCGELDRVPGLAQDDVSGNRGRVYKVRFIVRQPKEVKA